MAVILTYWNINRHRILYTHIHPQLLKMCCVVHQFEIGSMQVVYSRATCFMPVVLLTSFRDCAASAEEGCAWWLGVLRLGAGLALCPVRTCRKRKFWADRRAQRFPFPAHQGLECPAVLSDPCPWRSVGYARHSGNKWRLQWWHLEWRKWALWDSCRTRGFHVHSLLEGRGMYCFALPK